MVSPAQTIVGIRGTVQATLASQLVELFKKRWSVTADSKVEVTHLNVRPIIAEAEWQASPVVNLGFLPPSPPLSWHLRQCEQKAIGEQVNRSVNTKRSPQLNTALAALSLQAPKNIILSVGEVIDTLDQLRVSPEARR